jgi:polysaccharide pyruvyl transferase WcaK-like protein
LLEAELRGAGFTVHNPSWITTCVESRALVSLCDFVISNRMHIAVFSLSQNIPVISFIYQGKFEGLYNFYGPGEKFMFRKETVSAGELSESIQYIQHNRAALSATIKSANKMVMELSRENVRGFGG